MSKKQKRINLEITNRREGCLEQGGIVGRIESYPAELIWNIMGDGDPESVMGHDIEAYDRVPRTNVTLIYYLHYHHADKMRVVREGEIIK